MMDRIKLIRASMAEQNLDAFIVSRLTNIRYLTNFSGSNATFIIRPRSLYFITDGRYTKQVEEELFPLPKLSTYSIRNVVQCILEKNLLRNCTSVGIEADDMTVATFNEFRKKLRPVKIKPMQRMVEKTTISKTEREVEYIRKAAAIGDKVYKYILNFVKPGMRELDVAAEISYQAKKLGSEGDAFDIIVASGARGALPHGRASTKKIRKGDLVTLDFGCIVEGFNSDMTRTFCVGRASKEQRIVYDTVLAAQMAALEAVTAGISAKTPDDAARSVITQAGYGDAFTHSTGHGLGIDVHERPGISWLASKEIIPAGSVITIEPGIYLSDKLGVRIEDDVYVKNGSIEILNKSPKELIAV